ncbi:isoprenoid synthase domain-containing protein, partial [Coprinopsis sp. MPI-PUGE-AT-0042]
IIHIPDLLALWPIPRALNPSYPAIQAASSAWIAGFDLFPDQKRLLKHQSCDFLPAPLFGLCDLMCLFWYDDYTDKASPDVIRPTAEAIITTMESGPIPSDGCLGVELHRDFWERTVATFQPTAEAQQHFLKHYRGFLFGVFEEYIDREQEIIRGVPSYLSLRRETVAVKPAISLLALEAGVPPWVLECDWVKKDEICCIDMVIIGNDVYSWNAEQARGEAGHNLITTLMNIHSMSVQDTMNYADKLHQRVVDDFLQVRDNLDTLTISQEGGRGPLWDELVKKQTRRYIDSLAQCARGCDAWSSESARYALSEEFHCTRTVRILHPKAVRSDAAQGLDKSKSDESPAAA